MAASPKPSSTKRRTTKRKAPTTTTNTTTTLSPLITAITTALTSSHTFLHSHDLHLLPSHSLALQSSLSSSLSSLSKLQSYLQVQPHHHFHLSHSPFSSCWFHRFLLSSSRDDDLRWVDFFRMSKPTFYRLNSALADSISSVVSSSILPHFALGAALYKLAHNGSFSFVGKRFGLSSADCCRVFYAVCKVICEQLGGFLSGFGCDLGRILMGFERISLINCCGVLGVEKFDVEGGLLGGSGFLMVQALVDCEGRFLDVSAGWPSTFEPVSILRQTRLFASVEESKEVLNGPKIELKDGNLMPQYILGDSCFPCLEWLLTPFVRRGEIEKFSSSENKFNEVHHSAMGLVKMAFRRVRANWQLLNRRWKEDSVEFMPFIIVAACVLNNFLIKHGEMLSDESDHPCCWPEQDMPVYDGEVEEGAARNRDMLALHLSRVRQDS